jgi:RNA polymerase sigma-70 factor (ECF subfamily)
MAVAFGKPQHAASGYGQGGARAGADARREPHRPGTEGIVARAVQRAQQGDMEAIGFLYARYAEDVVSYLRHVVGDVQEAEDLTQQVFTKLITAIVKYEPREAPFVAWVMRVARNLALDYLRARRCVPVEEVREAVDLRTDVGGGAVLRSQELRAALAGLPAEQREVLILRHLGGLSPGEIALRTGRTEGSVHGLHHRGRRALQADLCSRGLAPGTRAPAAGRKPSADYSSPR